MTSKVVLERTFVGLIKRWLDSGCQVECHSGQIRKENTMFLSIRSIVKRIPFKGMVSAFMVIALTLFPLLASAAEEKSNL